MLLFELGQIGLKDAQLVYKLFIYLFGTMLMLISQKSHNNNAHIYEGGKLNKMAE